MKISQSPAHSGATVSQTSTAVSSGKAATRTASPQDVSQAQLGTEVSLSSTVLNARSSGSDADFDVDKVNAMREAIANGTYTVNPEAIADKLLANAQEMLSRTPR